MKKLGAVTAVLALVLAGCVGMTEKDASTGRVWRKGQLHAHTLWSDGNGLPEAALAFYRAAGFSFVCLSDHDQFQTVLDNWIQVEKEAGPWPGRLTETALAEAEKLVPGGIDTRKIWNRKYARLKPFAELAQQFDEPETFLVVPGQEVARTCHMNVFNVSYPFEKDLPWTDWDISRTNVTKWSGRIYETYRRHAKADDGSFLMMNHPFWSLWDVDPRVMLDRPELTLWEVCNSGAERAPRELTMEKAWDFVLAHRLVNGGKLVYGTATDDTHNYSEVCRHGCGGLEGGWVVVDCPGALTAENLSRAIVRGDFYASCGVELEDFRFDRATGTLSVKARPRPGEKLRIDFIVTKRDFDRTVVEQHVRAVQKEDFFRDLPKVNDTIGRVAKSVDGPVGAYTLAADDLYVRAVVVSDRPCVNRTPHYPETERAWVQPVR